MNLSGVDTNESVTRRSSGPVRRMDFRYYARSALFVGVALGTSLLLEHFHFRVPSAFLLLLAVAISSWYGGLGPAVLAVILSTIGFYWYFVEPVRTIYIDWSEIPYFIIFAALAALLSWFGTVRRHGEADLREQAVLLNLTHDAVFVMDMDGVLKYWNRAAEERYGWTADQAVGRVVHDLLKTVFPSPLDEIKAEVARAGRWEGELLHTKKDGSQLVVASRWALRRDKHHTPVAILETNNDITERKRAEETVGRHEAELRQVLDVAPQLVAEFGPDRQRLYANQPTLDYFGVTLEEWRSISDPFRFFHPDDRERMADVYTGPASDVPHEFEARMRRNDGTYRWFLFRDSVLRDEQGRITRWYLAATDIEERKRTEEELRQTEGELRQLVDVIPQQVFVFDADWSPVFANRGELEYTGLTSQEMQSKEAVARIFHPEDLKNLEVARERARSDGAPFEMEARIRGKDGVYRWFLIRDNPLRDEHGRILRWYGTRTDIQDRKWAEEARSKSQAELAHFNRVTTMGELVASIAHEVNQPLSGIVSNSSACLRWLAGNSPNLEEAREAVLDIVRDGKRAGEIVARIRALTKKTAAAREKLDLNGTILEVLALVGDEARRSSVTVRTLFADDLSPVAGDRVQLQQVVLNLVMNAIEVMSSIGERARELVITTRNIDANQVQVTVEDSGIGLDPNAIDKIFDSFYTTKPSGMGMGLSISRSILQAHGGRLWATAKDSPGTMFHFTIPKYPEERAHEGAT